MNIPVVKKYVSQSQIVLSLLLAGLFSHMAHAQIEIDISGGEVRGIPIAIVPFQYVEGGALETDVARVVTKDLAASGKFDPINPGRFLTNPSTKDEVREKDWRALGAEVLVIGQIWKIAEDNFEIQFRMFDIAREQEVGQGKRIPNLRGSDLRAAAHIVSDQVYQAFTGRPGAFHSRIAYIQRDEVEFQRYQYKLMVADWDGYGASEVYTSWQPLLSPSWSPDGKKLAFVSFADTGSVVQTLELTTGTAEVIASYRGINSAPSWSPDGQRLAYSSSRNGSPDVFVYNLQTKTHDRLNSHYAIDTEPSWSPSGDALLFTSSRTGKPQIYRYDLTKQRAERITFAGKESANASYDYDAKRIAMVNDGGKIAVMNVASGEVTYLTNAKFDESPSFSPNGDMVLYTAESDFGSTLVVASSDGRVRTRLEYINGDVREPAWSLSKK